MRFTLIQPPNFYPKDENLILPVGALALASYAKNLGHMPIIIDLNYPIKKGILNYKKKNFFKDAARYIIKRGSNFLGFSVVNRTLPTALLIAKECKKLNPHSFIVLGGPEVSFEDVPLLRSFEQVDAVVRGEGEITLTYLLSALEQGRNLSRIKGLTFRRNSKIISNSPRNSIKNLDRLPYLDYHRLSHLKEYKQGAIEGGRGCPYRCAFCSTCKMWGNRFRIKSSQRLAKELKYVSRQFPGKASSPIKIIHDNLLAKRSVIHKFLSIIACRKINWTCSARLDTFNYDLIKKLRLAGCQHIYIGIESGSEIIQKKIKKYVPRRRLYSILQTLSDNDINLTLSFIIGFPYEMKTDLNKTLLMALKVKLFDLQPRIQIHPLVIHKGSELYLATKDSLRKSAKSLTPFSYFLSAHKAELSLVEKHPDIFPSFYPNSACLSVEDYQNISDLFIFLANSFPITTLILLKAMKQSPLSLAFIMRHTFKKMGFNWRHPLQTESSLHHYIPYIPYLRKFLKIRNFGTLINEVATHEEMLLQASFVQITNCFKKKAYISLSSMPYFSKSINIQTYNYDISEITYKLRRHKHDFSKKKTTLAYIPGKITKVLSLGPNVIKLLSLCNGKRTAYQIIENMINKGPSRQLKETFQKLILETLGFLLKNEIIKI